MANNLPTETKIAVISLLCENMSIRGGYEGKSVWEGKVEVFTLTGHPKATEAFAWNYPGDAGKKQAVAVLNIPPIETPSDAVRAAIASGKIQ